MVVYIVRDGPGEQRGTGVGRGVGRTLASGGWNCGSACARRRWRYEEWLCSRRNKEVKEIDVVKRVVTM